MDEIVKLSEKVEKIYVDDNMVNVLYGRDGEFKSETCSYAYPPDGLEYSNNMSISWNDLVEIENKRMQAREIENSVNAFVDNNFLSYDLKGLLVLYVDIRDAMPGHEEEYVDATLDKSQATLKKIPLDYGVIILPIKGETRMEYIKF